MARWRGACLGVPAPAASRRPLSPGASPGPPTAPTLPASAYLPRRRGGRRRARPGIGVPISVHLPRQRRPRPGADGPALSRHTRSGLGTLAGTALAYPHLLRRTCRRAGAAASTPPPPPLPPHHTRATPPPYLTDSRTVFGVTFAPFVVVVPSPRTRPRAAAGAVCRCGDGCFRAGVWAYGRRGGGLRGAPGTPGRPAESGDTRFRCRAHIPSGAPVRRG